MSRSKSELSLNQREILQFITYRTRSKVHPTFFGSNEYIAKYVNVQPDTVRKAIKKLEKLGYLMEAKDEHGRRHMAYTGKEFAPIVADMRNYEKRLLMQERDNYLRDMNYYKKEYELAKIRIDVLDKENSELRTKLLHAETRLMQMEQSLLSQGATKELIDRMITQTLGMQLAS